MTNVIKAVQMRVYTGDLRRNVDNILSKIRQHSASADILVFPEMCVTGYNLGARLETELFLREAMLAQDEIVRATEGKNLYVVFGNLRYDKVTHKLYNSAFVAYDGRVIAVYDKIMLANDSHHEDRHYFTPGSQLVTFQANDETIGVLICEDIWVGDHGRDLTGEMKAIYPNLSTVLCVNYSYYAFGKTLGRLNTLRKVARQHSVNIVYVNALGIGDIVKNFILYDGESWFVAKSGYAVKMPAWKECVSSIGSPELLKYHNGDAPYYYKSLDVHAALIFGLKALFEETGIPNAQVHLSGGIDSALVAYLLVQALGKERVVAISNPSVHNGSESQQRATKIASVLGLKLHWLPVQPLSNAVAGEFQKSDIEVNNMAVTTFEAVGRTVIGLAACHSFKSAIVATGNHTENILGWFSFHDVGSVGICQPLGDLTKLELYDLSDYINELEGREIIPRELYDGTVVPAAELADSKDDPFDYDLYSGICALFIRARKSPLDLIRDFDLHRLPGEYFLRENQRIAGADSLIGLNCSKETFEAACWDAYNRSQRSVYKCAQSAPPFILSPRARGFSARETILGNYQPGAILNG